MSFFPFISNLFIAALHLQALGIRRIFHHQRGKGWPQELAILMIGWRLLSLSSPSGFGTMWSASVLGAVPSQITAIRHNGSRARISLRKRCHRRP